jgi:Tfp pilus assembly protein PilP
LFGQEANEYKLFKSNTYVKNPLDLRDPFKRRINKKKSNNKKNQAQMGIYTNYSQTLEGKPIESIQVIGVVIGAERRAMVRVTGDEKNIVYLKEGMKIGENGAEVKAILPGGVVLVEKIRNVYDQDEYLETIIPVSE